MEARVGKQFILCLHYILWSLALVQHYKFKIMKRIFFEINAFYLFLIGWFFRSTLIFFSQHLMRVEHHTFFTRTVKSDDQKTQWCSENRLNLCSSARSIHWQVTADELLNYKKKNSYTNERGIPAAVWPAQPNVPRSKKNIV